MPDSMIGLRIRERRLAAGLRQGDLARRIGISPSYLNLIERNKRRVSADLARRAAEALGAPLSELDGALERRMADRLVELAADPEFADLALSAEDARDLLGRHPAWGRALARAWRARRDAARSVEALSDRLTHDPFVSEAMHGMLTRIAAMRSTSEILEQVEDIDAGQRRRFHGILAAESARLSEVAESLTQFFDRAHRDAETSSPAEDVEEAFLEARNRFAALEPRTLAGGADRPEEIDADLRRWAREGATREAEGDAVASTDDGDGGGDGGADAQAAAAAPALADRGPAARRRALARAAARARFDQALEAEIALRPRLAAGAANRRARAALEEYAADALLMPGEAMRRAGEATGWDLDALAERFAVPFDAAARRLTTLGADDLGAPAPAGEAGEPPAPAGAPRSAPLRSAPGTAPSPAPRSAPRSAYVRVNAAGVALARRLLPEIALPRHGAACPLWAIYAALSSPGRTLRQLAEFPSGERFVFVARAEPAGPMRWDRAAPMEASLAAIPAQSAMETVYAPRPRETAEPVGPNCRVCARSDCIWRAEDPLVG